MVPRGGIEPPTQGFSGPCSTTELPRQILKSDVIILKKSFLANFFLTFLIKTKKIKRKNFFSLFFAFWNSVIIKKISCNLTKQISRSSRTINICSRSLKLYNYYKFWVFYWSISSIWSICPTCSALIFSFIKYLCCSSFSS